MSKILELREKRAKAWDAAKAFLDTKRDDDGLISAEDSVVYDKMEEDVLALGKEIDRLERQSALDAQMATPTNAPITNNPTQPETEKTGRASNQYRADFVSALRGHPTVHNVLQVGTDSDGGYLVPAEFERQIVSALDEYNIVRSIAKVITTNAERKIPIAATQSVAQWTAENAAITASSPTFDQKTLDAFKLTDLVKVSVELLQDSAFDIESYLSNDFARAFGAKEEEAFCIGNGTTQPTGIFTAAGGDVGVTLASATVITSDNLIDLIYSLKSPYRRNAVWLLKDSTIRMIRKLKDANGAYLWQPSLQEGQPDRLAGYPIHTSPYAPEVEADAFPIAFGDFSNYWIADRAARSVQRLNELYAGNGQIGFLATERVDGKVILAEGIQLLQMGS